MFGPLPMPEDAKTLQSMLDAAFLVLITKPVDSCRHSAPSELLANVLVEVQAATAKS